MTEKTFEEQFPSLKGKGGDNHCSGCECDGSESPIFSIQELQNNCLDKQKTRKVINKIYRRYTKSKIDGHCMISQILKELGL